MNRAGPHKRDFCQSHERKYENMPSPYDMTLSSSAVIATGGGKFGSGYLQGGYGTINGALIANNTATSFDFWAKIPDLTGKSIQYVFSQYTAGQINNFYLNLIAGPGDSLTNVAIGSTNTQDVSSNQFQGMTISFSDGNWHHFRAVFNGELLSLGIDGVLATITSTTYTATFNASNIFIGGDANPQPLANSVFTGAIDELAIFNIALPLPTVIKNPYTLPTAPWGGTETGLTALYHFDGNANDSGPSSTSGAVTNTGTVAISFLPELPTGFNTIGAVSRVQGTWTDRGGTIANVGQSQILAPANTARKTLFVANPPSATESLFINFTSPATPTPGASIEIAPGASYSDPNGFVTTEQVNVTAATAGHVFSAKEG